MLVGVNGFLWIKTEKIEDLLFLMRTFKKIGQISRESLYFEIEEYFKK